MSSSESNGRIAIDLRMANSDQLILVHDDHHEDDELGKDGPSDDHQSTPGLAAPSDEDQEQCRRNHQDDEAENLQDWTKTTSPPSSASASAGDQTARRVDENDDGFRTPTSSAHKIPAATQCPPAPRKPRPSPKRKAAAMSAPIGGAGRGSACRNLIFDFSEREFEPMFPSAARGADDGFVLNFKKPRRDIQEKD